MKIYSFKTVATITVLGTTLLVNAAPVIAAEYKGTSKVGVDVKSDTLIIPDPTDPTNPPTTPASGNFGLLYTPKEYIFEDLVVPNTTTPTETSVSLKTPETVTNPKIKNVAVGDVRGTRKSGWTLTAKLAGDLTSTTNGTKTLTGATINSKQVLKELIDPKNNVIGDVVNNNFAPTVVGNVTFSNVATKVMSARGETTLNAADGKGEGYWNGQFSDIKLIVPGGTMGSITVGDKYTGTIDWTLVDAFS